ncbi:MAG TPA: DMT family transporter, partial [Acetobacteraceae bacterium]|nr:DMT family transporter [Acetobacteraceae bacterium]
RVERAQPAAGRAEGLALLLFTVVGWGLNWPALKLVLEHLPPFSMRTVTAAAAGTVVMAMAALRGERLAPPSGQWRRLTLAAFLNYTSWLGFVSVSLVWLPASTAVIITYTMPVWAMCLAWPVLGERPRASHLMGLALGIGGVAAVLDGGRAAIPPGGLPGVACALAASVLFALGSVITKRAPLSMPPFAAVGWQILIGVVPIAVLALLLERPDFGALALHDWLALAYTAFVGLVVSYLCWFRALKLLPASVATAGTLLVPLVGVFGSGLVLGEPIGPAQLLALALTISGVALVARS